jgi:glycerate-2-kinase
VLFLPIKNKSQLLAPRVPKDNLILRQLGLAALERAISAVKPNNLIEKAIKLHHNILFIGNDEYNLSQFDKIYIIGGGKASAEMALSLEKILLNLEDIDYEGIINIPETQKSKLKFQNSKLSFNYASHPVPNLNGFKGVLSMMKLIEESSEQDLIICLISGGGSALLPLPKNNIKIKDLQKINSLLLASGASIQEINTIRKHISEFKGGNLAKKVYNSSQASLITLIISDVVGDNLDSIASGPTVPDITTYQDALNILKKYNLLEKIPVSIKKHLEKGLNNTDLENPKPDNRCFSKVYNYLIGSVASAVHEVKSLLNTQNYQIHYFSNNVVGEAREFGQNLQDLLFPYVKKNLDLNKQKKIALIGTGELTVTIKGKGIGGRNQEMLLSFLNNIKDKELRYLFLIIGVNLDGIEGNSKAMGALADNFLLDQMISLKVDPKKFLLENDSNAFFKKFGCEIITGPTGCNVNDLILILIST